MILLMKHRGISDFYVFALSAVVVLALLYAYSSGQQGPQQPAPTPGPSITATPSPAAATAAPSAAANFSGGPAIPPEEPFSAAECGDFRCDASERCDTCSQDCGCAGGEYCNRLNGVCYELQEG